MSDAVRGMVVYHREDYRRGTVTAGNQFTGMIAVQWDDGTRQLIQVGGLMSEKLYNEMKQEERVNKMALKEHQAVIGTVVYLSAKEAPLRKGKIAGPLDNTHGNKIVIVEWDTGQIDKRQLNALLSEVDGIVEEQRLLDEEERLEREWVAVEEACKNKLQQAAGLINEAARLAESKGKDLSEMYEATSSLERAMGDAGWRTSSWGC